MLRRALFFLLAASVFVCCQQKSKTLFTRLSSDDTGITFRNDLKENDSLNILTLEYIYNGAGVAAADFNNDGLTDLFFTGNQVSPKLYLNKGNFEFEDVSEQAGLANLTKWYSGVAAADLNADGFTDLYVCATINDDSTARKNVLLINQGVGDGVPSFRDEAASYGLDFDGYSTNAAFIDYDNDGDLDVYIITNTIQAGIPTSYRNKMNDGTNINTDRLFRNNGDKTFSDVSGEAGIVHEGYGLGLAICDINLDGWQDIYVSNDYITNDLLYINNKNGTFTNAIDSLIKHQSQFSMGNDVADMNNDALPDIVTLDMLPEKNLRRKTVIHAPNYSTYINNERYGYAHQYTRNMLQLNNGNGTFSEIGQLSGVHQTEWSWSPLLADFNNDGYRDLIITNGFPRDITDKDFANFRSDPGGALASNEILLDSVPVVKIPNYAFVNNKDLTFKDVTSAWGLEDPSFSYGAAFADFDNDGDLDYVINNINDEAFVYRNNLMESNKDSGVNFLRLKLTGPQNNLQALGAKVTLYSQGNLQYHDHSLFRGYLSTVENVIHFGLGSQTRVDSVVVRWPDGNVSVLKTPAINQVITLDHKQSKTGTAKQPAETPRTFKEIAGALQINYKHAEQDMIDFNIQRTIPHKFSQAGPGLAVGDANGDGLDDFYVGGSSTFNGVLWTQTKKGTFTAREVVKSTTKLEEDRGALFFDADGDGDQDLYVVSGSFEFRAGSAEYQDRLYFNDGRGNFALNAQALPNTTASGSCVRAADFDRDGDLDLFVGGRVVPAAYPMPAQSYLLVNEGGKFSDKTNELAPDLGLAGMVTDALWTDVNNDGKSDLLVIGEFMAPTIFLNSEGRLIKAPNDELQKNRGWWNSITSGDYDSDGDIDYVLGNLGANNFYKASPSTPLRVYAKDLDENNSVDAVLTCYLKAESGEMKEFPVHFLDELNSQSPKFRRRFAYYKKYGVADLERTLTPEERKDALILDATNMSTSMLENLGDGKFRVTALPVLAQTAPVNGIVSEDIDSDGDLDLLLIGNDYGNEVFTGRHDAFNGLVLTNDGDGKFAPLPLTKSGFVVRGDGKALSKIVAGNKTVFLASQNRDSLKAYESTLNSSRTIFKPEADDISCEFTLANGKKSKVELYWGAGYLAQSTRQMQWPANVKAARMRNVRGEVREIKPANF